MAAEITRRAMVGTTALGLAGMGIGAAAAAEQPKELFGSVAGGKVTLPNLSAPSEVPGEIPTPDPVQKRLGVAVVGLGRLSLGQILPGFGQSKSMRVTALVSGEADKARAVAAQHGVPEKNLYDYKTFDRLRDNPDVDVVYILLPNAMHAEYTARAARAGKHVLCEKPMATSVQDAQRMIDACRDAKRKLMIAYRCQYPAFAYDNLAMRVGKREGKASGVEERKLSTGNQFAVEMDHFADSIRADKTPRTPGEEGLQDLRLIAAIYKAAASGGMVRLPAVEGKDTTRGPALPAEQG